MIQEKKVLGIIPARGGSKRVLKKNIREISRHPLISWTIDQAKKSKFIDRVILSSDDAETIAIAKSLGCDVPFVRPANVSLDETPGVATVLHAIENFPEYEIVVLLQPTSPLRAVTDIDACIERLSENSVQSCVSVTKIKHHLSWLFTLEKNSMLRSVSRRDDTFLNNAPPVFGLNGAVYAAEVPWVTLNRTLVNEETVGFEMPLERSLDIDTEDDLRLFQLRVLEGEIN
ncbi:MAG: acylneuraminate cytidylyltransferase family protein [Burkholderiales bacterium]|nr:acylneuraminate cytidylyltransferase family protein [Burkholderiales bacterium]